MARIFAAGATPEVDLAAPKMPVYLVFSLHELHAWLQQILGPMASEVLGIFADCVFDEDSQEARCPPAFRRLHRVLCNQGLDRFEAERVMREGYGQLLSQLGEWLPKWAEINHYQGMEHSMRGCKSLVLVIHPELPKSLPHAGA